MMYRNCNGVMQLSPSGRRMVEVTVSLAPKFHTIAHEKGYDIEPFDAYLVARDYPYMFWNVVRPMRGRHCAELALPPMFEITRRET